MPTYSLLVTTPLLDGTQAPEPPLPFDATDDVAAIRIGEAEAERRMAAGAAWVCIDVLGPHGGSMICPPIVRPPPSANRAALKHSAHSIGIARSAREEN